MLTVARSPKSVSTRMRLTASLSARLTVLGVWVDVVLMARPRMTNTTRPGHARHADAGAILGPRRSLGRFSRCGTKRTIRIMARGWADWPFGAFALAVRSLSSGAEPVPAASKRACGGVRHSASAIRESRLRTARCRPGRPRGCAPGPTRRPTRCVRRWNRRKTWATKVTTYYNRFHISMTWLCKGKRLWI